MPVENLEAIDSHAHYGTYVRKDGSGLINRWMTNTPEGVVERARQARTCLTVVSPLLALLPRFEADAVAGNEEVAGVVAKTEELLQWAVVNPRQSETYAQAARMLRLPKCVGIKIHPEEHGYHISECGREILEFAAEHRAVVLTHSGEANSQPVDFVPFADGYPEVKLILAHLGFSWDNDPTHQVRAIQAGKHDNIFADTSSRASIIPGLLD